MLRTSGGIYCSFRSCFWLCVKFTSCRYIMGCKKQWAGEPRLCRSYRNWTSCRQRKASFFGLWFFSQKDTFTVPAHRSARCISFIHFKITSHVKGLKGNWQKVFMATELWAWLASLAGRFLSTLRGGKINTRNCGYAAIATDIICVRSEALTETGSCEGSNAPPEEWREDDLHPVGKTHLDQCDPAAHVRLTNRLTCPMSAWPIRCRYRAQKLRRCHRTSVSGLWRHLISDSLPAMWGHVTKPCWKEFWLNTTDLFQQL